MFEWSLRIIPSLLLIFHFLGSFPCLALEKRDSSALSHYITGLYYDNLGESDEAAREYEKALKLDSDNYLTHFNLAATLIRKNDLARARRELGDSIRLNPDAAEPHALLAILNVAEGNWDLAAKEYEIALKIVLKLNPNIEIYKSLGVLYASQGNIKEAKETYLLLSQLAPYDPEAHFYLGVIYSELKDTLRMKEELNKAIALNPDYAQALNYLGYSYIEEGKNLKEAEKLIKRALKISPDNGAYLDSLGWLYYKKGKLKESKELLTKAVSLTPDSVIFDHLGDVYFKLKDSAKARANWQESLKLDPDQKKVKEKLKKL